MRLLKLGGLALAISLLTSCGSAEPPYTVRRLPSGREVKVLGVGKMFFAKGDPALMLKYRTDLHVEDKDELRREVDEIWQAFRVDVERAGLKAAIISAHEPSTRLFIITTNKSYNFVIQKSDAGKWEFLDSGAGKQTG